MCVKRCVCCNVRVLFEQLNERANNYCIFEMFTYSTENMAFLQMHQELPF